MSRSIQIVIDTDGSTKVEAVGHSGGSCVKAMSPLTKTLIGGKPQQVETKPEFYLPESPVRLRETE